MRYSYGARREARHAGGTKEMDMASVRVVFYCGTDGRAPVLGWLDDQPVKVQNKFMVRIDRLAECGSQLSRPEAAPLRDGIYELRVRHMNVNYRMLYFFSHGVAVLAHGATKEKQVDSSDIDRAQRRMREFEQDPGAHTYSE
jgi:phage-related protein